MLPVALSLDAGGTRKRGFNWLAPHYRWMERVLAGSQLQACRTRFLPAISGAKRILLLGEGPGRFLSEIIRSGAEITCIDSSAEMLSEARKAANGHVIFVHADALEYQFPRERYDAVATHFFLDCFRPDQLDVLVSRIAQSLVPGGAWLLSDFRLPSRGLARWRAALILKSMYLFFRAATALPAGHLTEPDLYLKENGLALVRRETVNWGLLHSDLWRKG